MYFWRNNILFHFTVMTHFPYIFTSCHTFQTLLCIYLLTSWRDFHTCCRHDIFFDIMTHFSSHDILSILFDTMRYYLTSWHIFHTFDFMTYFLTYLILYVVTYSLMSWHTFYTFWRHQILLYVTHEIFFDIMMYFPNFLTSCCTFTFWQDYDILLMSFPYFLTS